MLVSLLTAIAAGIPLAMVPTALLSGFGSTLGSVALLVGFGVMLGRLLEVTGGAQVLADSLINRFGEKRAPFALGVAALIFGFPIFFDAGLVVFLPIILTVARRFGGSVLLYALPAAGAFAAMHALVPPHPGPVAAGTALGGDIGVILLVGLPVAVISWYLGVYLVSKVLGRRFDVPVSDMIFGELDGGEDRPAIAPPAFGTVLGLLLIPLVLISFNTSSPRWSPTAPSTRARRWVEAAPAARQHARRAARQPARWPSRSSAGASAPWSRRPGSWTRPSARSARSS